MKPTAFALVLQRYLTQYLSMQRNLSANTIKAYRDTMTLFLRFCRDHKGWAIERFETDRFTPALIESFINHLERDRGCGIRTRNQRLAALHAFARYLQSEQPECVAACQQILALPLKRCAAPEMQYLTSDQMACLLAQPNLRACL